MAGATHKISELWLLARPHETASFRRVDPLGILAEPKEAPRREGARACRDVEWDTKKVRTCRLEHRQEITSTSVYILSDDVEHEAAVGNRLELC